MRPDEAYERAAARHETVRDLVEATTEYIKAREAFWEAVIGLQVAIERAKVDGFSLAEIGRTIPGRWTRQSVHEFLKRKEPPGRPSGS